jgi:adenylate cyclase class IV
MAESKEIEIKWNAYSTERQSSVERSTFNRAIRKYVRGKKSRKLVIAGFDYYYESKDGYVGRHRHGSSSNELTTKARTSKRSTTIRAETNLMLEKSTSPLQVQEFFLELGFPKVLPIFKDCDIYFIKEGQFVVDVVWYRVTCGKAKVRDFIEVEVHEAPVKQSLAILNRWKKFLQAEFGITDADIVHESLYEIYSGKRYRMSARMSR